MEPFAALEGIRAARLQRVGWIVITLSLVVPAADLQSFGVVWIGAAPYFGVQFLIQPFRIEGESYSLSVAAIGLCLLAGFAANLILFSRVRRWLLVLTPFLTLFPMGAYWYHWAATDSGVAPWLLFHFYPWAAGVTLVCLGRIRLGGIAAHVSPRIAYVA
jgi:hypothetical protein